MTDTQPGTEVARAEKQPVHVPLAGALENMDQAWRMAQGLAQSDLVPTDLRGKPANVFLIMLYGQRLGLPPEIAISTVNVVKGRPRMAGQLLLAKVREAGHKPTVTHGDGECTVTIKRGDDATEHTETFSIDDAVTARLCKLVDGKVQARSQKGEALPWETYTKRMLMWRALGFCVDVVCPEVKMGFHVEGEFDTVADHPTLQQVAAEREDRKPDPALAEQLREDNESVAEPLDPDAAYAADLADIEREHLAEYGDGNTLPLETDGQT
jgi:hypothetical protein